MEKFTPIDQIEEVDTRGEDDDYFYTESTKERMEHEIIKLGQPWNIPVDILDPTSDEQIKKHGEEAIRLQQLREALKKYESRKTEQV